jgi:tetratricopeptide (TPR) repeat protein
MPIRRPRGPKPALKHIAFLEAADRLPESSAGRKPLEAAFLTLRVLDQWMWLGMEVADPTSQVLTAAKSSVQAAAKDDAEAAAALGGILDAIVMLQEPDAQPVLPRVFALGRLYEARGALSLAADVYGAVVKFVDSRAHFDLSYDALMRHAYCQRMSGVLDQAERSYESAGALAARARDRVRVLYSRIGDAKVTWARGNLPAAEAALEKVVSEAATIGNERVHSVALHDSACLARQREKLPEAVRLAFEAFRRSTDELERERILMDLATFLSLTGAYATARTALSLVASSAKQRETVWFARMNSMDVCAREGAETSFEQHRRELESESMPPRLRAMFLKDAGRGLASFGRVDEARRALGEGRSIASQLGLHFLEHEIVTSLDSIDRVQDDQRMSRRAPVKAPDDIAALIDDLVRSSVGAYAQ